MKLLYYSPSAIGGLADYAHEQANALAHLGVSVRMLTSPNQTQRANYHYEVRPLWANRAARRQSGLARRIAWVYGILRNIQILNREIQTGNHAAVLLGCYVEYLAPVWAGQLRARARSGVVFGAVIHDPVRDYVVGPQWWHRRSIASAYSFLREAFVHEEIQLETVRPMPTMRTTVIPHGPYQFPEPTETQRQVRERLDLPETARVALSFGHIRDGKNLDLVLRAMSEAPSMHLVVAGKEQSSGQRPISYYQELARQLRVQDRCRWLHGHIPQSEVGGLFSVADLILLTYSRDFRSASGVLNVAVSYRKPCLASSGGGNLRSVVDRYRLGWFVEPDSLTALKAGIAIALRERIDPAWQTYEADNSWERNAQIVKGRMSAAI